MRKISTRNVSASAVLLSVIAGAALAGCGSTAGDVRTGPSATPAPAVAQVATMAQVLFITGATDATPLPGGPTLYARQEDLATWHGQNVDIAVFASAQLRNSWVTIARNFGPILGEGYAWAMTTGS